MFTVTPGRLIVPVPEATSDCLCGCRVPQTITSTLGQLLDLLLLPIHLLRLLSLLIMLWLLIFLLLVNVPVVGLVGDRVLLLLVHKLLLLHDPLFSPLLLVGLRGLEYYKWNIFKCRCISLVHEAQNNFDLSNYFHLCRVLWEQLHKNFSHNNFMCRLLIDLQIRPNPY